MIYILYHYALSALNPSYCGGAATIPFEPFEPFEPSEPGPL